MIVKTKIIKKTTFTRMCIAEAILELLDTIDFEKLKDINYFKKIIYGETLFT